MDFKIYWQISTLLAVVNFLPTVNLWFIFLVGPELLFYPAFKLRDGHFRYFRVIGMIRSFLFFLFFGGGGSHLFSIFSRRILNSFEGNSIQILHILLLLFW